MSEIVLIRTFERPIGFDYFERASVALNWCRKVYGVSPRLHFLADDGLRCACIFAAPDAEAVRNVIRSGDRSEPEALWPCTIHSGPQDDGASDPLAGDATRTMVLVERAFAQPARPDDVHPAALAAARDVQYARSYLSGDRLRAISVYTAPDLETVRAAHRAAGLSFDRMWAGRAMCIAREEAVAQTG